MYRFIDFLDLKKDKSAVHSLRQFLFNDKQFSEVQIAKFLASTLTHIMIETENAVDDEDAINRAIGYKADLIATIVHNLILGLTTPEVSRRVLLKVIEDERNTLNS